MNALREPLAVEEAVKLGALDGPLYAEYFFPRTVRQQTPQFHREIWLAFESPNERYLDFKVFRDGAKTTIARLVTSKRIAYAISRTIMYTSASEAHAARSLRWIRRQILTNTAWSTAFGLRQGSKWTDTEMEIIHGVEEIPINLIAVGITGQVRGVNIDDYRPDFIICDDPDNEETTGTKEQRAKAHGLFFGALANSLSPPSESPLAKMGLLQTPLAEGDLIDTCSKDPSWCTVTYGILTDEGESRWPDRYPTKWILQEKGNAIHRNQLSLWMREKECKIVGDELASFKKAWLNYYELLPEGLWYVIALDPAISDSKEADDAAIVVWGCGGRRRYLVDYFVERGVEPDALIVKLFEFIMRYRTRGLRKLVVETVAFQKVLAFAIRAAMKRYRIYVPVYEHDDKRRKADVILQSFLEYAPHGEIYIRQEQVEFLQAFMTWHPNYLGHDDLLDAGARGLAATMEGEGAEYPMLEDLNYVPLPPWRTAP